MEKKIEVSKKKNLKARFNQIEKGINLLKFKKMIKKIIQIKNRNKTEKTRD